MRQRVQFGPTRTGAGKFPCRFQRQILSVETPYLSATCLSVRKRFSSGTTWFMFSVIPDEEREKFAPYHFTYAAGQSPWHGIDQNFEKQKHRDRHFVERFAIVGNYVGLVDTHPIRCFKSNSLRGWVAEGMGLISNLLHMSS